MTMKSMIICQIENTFALQVLIFSLSQTVYTVCLQLAVFKKPKAFI